MRTGALDRMVDGQIRAPRTSTPLLADQIADGAATLHTKVLCRPLRVGGGGDKFFPNQPLEGSRVVQWADPGDRLASVGHGELSTLPCGDEVAAQVNSEISHVNFHEASMARLSQ